MIRSVTVTNYLGKSITLELGRPEESGFIVKNITGLGPDKATVNITEYTSEDGGVFNSARKSSKNIVLELEFLSYKETIEDVRQKSYDYFPLKREVNLKILTDNHELEIDGIVESNEPDIFSKNEGCQISIVCPNPYFREIYNQETFSSGDEAMFEFPFWNDLEPLLDEPEPGPVDPDADKDILKRYDDIILTDSNKNIPISDFFGPKSNYSKYDTIYLEFTASTFVSCSLDVQLRIESQGMFARNLLSEDFTNVEEKVIKIEVDVNDLYDTSHLYETIRFGKIPLNNNSLSLTDIKIYVPKEVSNKSYFNKNINKDTKIILKESEDIILPGNYANKNISISDLLGSYDIYKKYDTINLSFTMEGIIRPGYSEFGVELSFVIDKGPTQYYLVKEKMYDSFVKEYDIEIPIILFDEYNFTAIMLHAHYHNSIKMSDIICYHIVTPKDEDEHPELYYPEGTLVDESLPYYTFEQDGKKYNLRGSKGIVFGELHNNTFKHIVDYKGTIETGFVMTIEFTKDFMPKLDNYGYLVIKNPRYLNKNMVIDLTVIKELIPDCSYNYYAYLDGSSGIPEYMYDSTGKIIPSYVKEEDLSGPRFGKKGDVIIIDTRKGNKGLYYQSSDFNPIKKVIEDSSAKPYRYYILWAPEIDGDWGIHYSLNDVKFYDRVNVLTAINRDVEWFQIGPGYNILEIHHTFNPQTLYDTEDDQEYLQASSLDIKVENTVYYEGV